MDTTVARAAAVTNGRTIATATAAIEREIAKRATKTAAAAAEKITVITATKRIIATTATK